MSGEQAQVGGTARASRAPVRVFDLHCDTIDYLGMRELEPYGPKIAETLASRGLDPTGADPYPEDLMHNRGSIALDRVGPARHLLWAQCFAVWVPDLYHRHGARLFYQKALDYFRSQLAAYPDRVEQVRDARRVDEVLAAGKVPALLTVENASLLNHSVRAVDDLAADGVKMISLTWNDRNPIGSGNLTSDGLTTFGREAVRALEDARIVIDASHLNVASFADLVDVARRPFAASHSNSRAVCDDPRNLTDDEFRAVRDAGGVVGLSFHRGFITHRDVSATAPDTMMPGAWNAEELARRMATSDPFDPADVTFDELAAHVEHFLDLGGADTVCLGSDFDGSDTPAWLASCGRMPVLHDLMTRWFGDELADKLFYTNARDFFARNEIA